jgi:hypothetical protein
MKYAVFYPGIRLEILKKTEKNLRVDYGFGGGIRSEILNKTAKN